MSADTRPVPADALPEPFVDIDLPLPDRREGKVRISYRLPPPISTADFGQNRTVSAVETAGAARVFVTTDRVSAFDRIIAGIPFKGQVLNQLSAWWFERTADVVANHVIDVPDPNVLIAREAVPLPVEVVVRGAITGVTSTSLWQLYAGGAREIYGYRFPDGLRKNTRLPAPIVTPTTKPPAGSSLHDEPLSCAEVVERALVPASRWEQVTAAAIELFTVGQRVAAHAGLILADTKYEFGIGAGGGLLLIDEVHTPDSSRYWVADTYERRLADGDEPESVDKEPLRQALADVGYRGEGDPPPLGASVVSATSTRYVDAYERLTGARFQPGEYPVGERIAARLTGILTAGRST